MKKPYLTQEQRWFIKDGSTGYGAVLNLHLSIKFVQRELQRYFEKSFIFIILSRILINIKKR